MSPVFIQLVVGIPGRMDKRTDFGMRSGGS